MNSPHILIAEDETSLRTILKKLFQKKGLEVTSVGDGALALKKLREGDVSLALLDIKMPSMSGLEVLAAIKKERPKLYVILMTAQDTMKNAIEAMKQGAYDYVAKPFELEEIEILVEKALEARRLSEEVEQLRQSTHQAPEKNIRLVGKSKAIREIYKLIGKVSASDASILITGESGTGKELVARAIHQNSERAGGPFIAVNCAAIPRDLLESELFGYRKGAFTGATENRAGFFEMAHLGTLFLDEIGDLPMGLQGKLLRILQEKEIQRLGSAEVKKVDVRVLAATNQNLAKLVKAKKFREDLFFRLNVIPLHLPPLRERREDIPLLCEYFLQRLATEMKVAAKGISEDALNLLEKYPWPGNIRELENTVKRAAILSNSPHLTVEEFSFFLNKSEEATAASVEELGLEEFITERLKIFLAKVKNLEVSNLFEMMIPMVERPLLKLVLAQMNYNQIKTAKALGINRNTLRKKLKEYQIPTKGNASS